MLRQQPQRNVDSNLSQHYEKPERTRFYVHFFIEFIQCAIKFQFIARFLFLKFDIDEIYLISTPFKSKNIFTSTLK